jgi:RNA polymerase subunit RPABC4/transcription elongation factor Spt4
LTNIYFYDIIKKKNKGVFMKKCLKCECLYPDYHKKCPACGAEEKKEWKQSNTGKRIIKEENIQTDKNIFFYSTEDLKDIIEINSGEE